MNPGSTATIWPYLIEGNQSRDWSVLRHSAAWARFGVYGQHAHGHGVGSPAREHEERKEPKEMNRNATSTCLVLCSLVLGLVRTACSTARTQCLPYLGCKITVRDGAIPSG